MHVEESKIWAGSDGKRDTDNFSLAFICQRLSCNKCRPKDIDVRFRNLRLFVALATVCLQSNILCP